MTWTCIPVSLIACGAFVIAPLPHRAAFMRAHPVPACIRTAEPCHMVWEPDGNAVPLPRGASWHRPTIGDEPAGAAEPNGWTPAGFYRPYPPDDFAPPGREEDADRRHQHHADQGGENCCAAGGGGSPTSVPEPSGLPLLVVAVAALAALRRPKST